MSITPGGDYNGGYNPGNENSEEETDGGNTGGQGVPCAYGQCKELEKQKFKPQCGRRNHYGLGVRIQGFKEGESQFGEWPHICAVLQLDEQADGYTTKEVKVFTGGASLIAAGAVLTAAHKVKAFVEVPEKLVVRCGEWDTQTTGEPLKHQDRVVKKVILHPEFDRRNLAYTSALLILEEEFVLSQHIDTICLPEINEDFQDDTECHVKGWGKDKWEDGEYQVILKSVQMPMVPTDSCVDQLKTTKLGRRFRLHPSFVCAGGEEGKDACFGDGGGPLVCPNKHDSERYVQVGIVAWGIGCGNGVPGVYTSLSSIGCWIDYELKCNLGDKYELRYDARSCQNFQANNSQGGGGYGASQKCQVTWPAKSEYQRKLEDADSIDDGLKDDTTSAVRAYVTNKNGYVAMCIEGCRVDPEILNGYAGIKDNLECFCIKPDNYDNWNVNCDHIKDYYETSAMPRSSTCAQLYYQYRIHMARDYRISVNGNDVIMALKPINDQWISSQPY